MDWATAREAALDRDKGRCRRCPATATDVHHRRPKQMGGTKNQEIAFGLDNLVALCRECHSHIHRNPAQSYKLGWLVHSWDDPSLIPVPVPEPCDF